MATTYVYLAAFQLFAFRSSLWRPCVNVCLTVSLKALWLQWICMFLCNVEHRWSLLTSFNIILTSLVCQSFPSYFVVMCLFLLILTYASKVPQNAVLSLMKILLLWTFSLGAARDHRKHLPQPTAHIAQVSIAAVLFRFMTSFFFLNKSFSAIMSCADKPTHQCQSTVCNEQCWRERKQSQASLLVIGSYFLTVLSPSTSTLIGDKRGEPAELAQAPQSTTLKQDAITSQACQDDSAIQSQLCSGLWPDLGLIKRSATSPVAESENTTLFTCPAS